VSENFNRIIANADAPWVLPIGMDDRLDPDALTRMSDAVQAAEGAVGMVVAPWRRVGPDGAAVDAQYYGARPPVPTVLDTSVVDYLVHLDSNGNTQWAENLQRRDAEVPLARALLAALDAHLALRRVSARERRLVRRGTAMSFCQPGRQASTPSRRTRSPRCGIRSRPGVAVESVRVREHLGSRLRNRSAPGAVGSAQLGWRDAQPSTILMPALPALVAAGGHG